MKKPRSRQTWKCSLCELFRGDVFRLYAKAREHADKIVSIEKERRGVLVRVYRDFLSSESLNKEEAHPVLCVIDEPERGNGAAVKLKN